MPYNNYDSFQGIVDAFNILRESNQAPVKDYPASFEGIRDAVLDIKKEWGNIETGDYPTGWDEVNGNWVVEPQEGDLWFDQNQGRLMVWIGGAFYQTNGADQLTVVSDNAPTDEVTGAFWYQPTTSSLYLWDGTAWVLVTTGTTTLSTSALTLATPVQDYLNTLDGQWDGVSTFASSVGTGFNQERLNRWILSVLRHFDQSFVSIDNDKPDVTVNTSSPSTPETGDMWFDATDGELKLWDGNSWERVVCFDDVSADLAALSNQVSSQDTLNANRFTSIENSIAALPFSDYATTVALAHSENTLQTNINTLTSTVGDLNRFALVTDVNTDIGGHETRITALENATIDFSPYATVTALNTAVANLQTQVTANSAKASTSYVDTEVAAVQAQIPDISGLTTNTAFTAYQTTVGNTYLPKAGGTVTGQLVLDNVDNSIPTLDFSTNHAAGRKAMKFKSYAGTSNYVEFGITNDYWEYAFDFTGNEDFCWKHGTNGKQFSITKDGATAKNLYIADFSTNDSNGQVVTGVVNVKTKLTSLENSINTHTTDIAATNTALAAKKEIYYSDLAPSGTFINGDMWFDSTNLRLNVGHGNAWVSPDRVEDTVLKTAMYNAVNNSTDYASLKTNLLSALS